MPVVTRATLDRDSPVVRDFKRATSKLIAEVLLVTPRMRLRPSLENKLIVIQAP